VTYTKPRTPSPQPDDPEYFWETNLTTPPPSPVPSIEATSVDISLRQTLQLQTQERISWEPNSVRVDLYRLLDPTTNSIKLFDAKITTKLSEVYCLIECLRECSPFHTGNPLRQVLSLKNSSTLQTIQWSYKIQHPTWTRDSLTVTFLKSRPPLLTTILQENHFHCTPL
jgi:hypothetical protein